MSTTSVEHQLHALAEILANAGRAGPLWKVSATVVTPGQSRKSHHENKLRAFDQHSALCLAAVDLLGKIELGPHDDLMIYVERVLA
jgi:hypothetical protein